MPEDIFDEHQTADGRRRIQLTTQEREDLAESRLIEGAVALYLNLDDRLTNAQIAEQLGITPKQLKRLTNTELFARVYNDHFIELGHDPRLKAVRSAMTDLLPDAYNQMKELLTDRDTPAGTRHRLIMDIFKLCGIRPSDPQVSDKRELAEFLKEQNINIQELHVHNIPQDYRVALERAQEGEVEEYEVFEGEVTEVSDTGNEN